MRRRFREDAFDWRHADFDELIEYARNNWDYFYDREELEDMLLDAVRHKDYLTVCQISSGLYENPEANFFLFHGSDSFGSKELTGQVTGIEDEDTLRMLVRMDFDNHPSASWSLSDYH